MVRQRVRIRFRKQGDLRLLGHRDLARTWERWLRRAGIPLAMSQGFHPRPRINFPSALAAGVEGIDEVVEIELADALDAAELGERLARCAPPGLAINTIEPLPPSAPAAQVCGVAYELDIPPERRSALEPRLAEATSGRPLWIEREDDRPPIDLSTLLEHAALVEGVLHVRLRVDRTGGVRPRELLAALGLGDLVESGSVLRRTAVELRP